MCTTHYYTYAYPDGRREQSRRLDLCPGSRHGQPCVDNVVLQHPTHYLQYAPGPLTAPLPGYPSYAYPPTPPSPATPMLYRPGNDSDRSYRTGSRPRSPSAGVYINGELVVADHRPCHRHYRNGSGGSHRRSPSGRERIILVDGPPTPRTPPQVFSAPHTDPSSPSFFPSAPYGREHSSSRRPVIVDERRRSVTHVDMADVPRSRHARHSSSGSRGSSRHY